MKNDAADMRKMLDTINGKKADQLKVTEKYSFIKEVKKKPKSEKKV